MIITGFLYTSHKIFGGITALCCKNVMYPQAKYYMTQEKLLRHRKKLPVRGRNLLSQEETSSQGKKLPVTRRKMFL
jgi:hypothetical protein